MNTRLLLLILTFALASCVGSVDHEKYVDETILWYSENNRELKRAVKILLAHPSIKRVEDDTSQKYENLTDSDIVAYNSVLTISKNLNIKNIEVSR